MLTAQSICEIEKFFCDEGNIALANYDFWQFMVE